MKDEHNKKEWGKHCDLCDVEPEHICQGTCGCHYGVDIGYEDDWRGQIFMWLKTELDAGSQLKKIEDIIRTVVIPQELEKVNEALSDAINIIKHKMKVKDFKADNRS